MKQTTEGKGIKRNQKQFELVDKAMPYLMELSDICLETMGSITINVNGGHFKYVADRPQSDDPPVFEHKTINTPTKPTRVYKYSRKEIIEKNIYPSNSVYGASLIGMLLATKDEFTECPNEVICSKCGQFHTNKVGEISKHTYYLKNTSKLILDLICKVNQLSEKIK